MDSYQPIPVRSRADHHERDEHQGRLRVLLSSKAGNVVVAVALFFGVIGVLRVMLPFHSAPDAVSVVQAQEEAAPQSTPGGEAVPGSGKEPVEEKPAECWVYVTGAVASPGVVSIPPGSRLEVAVAAAGGLSSTADETSVNLARPVEDGEHVHVAAEGENPVSDPSNVSGPSNNSDGGGSASLCVDLNTATSADLATLDGVGPKIAARIIDYRESSGGFASNDELLAVSGIGPKLLQRISAGLCPG